MNKLTASISKHNICHVELGFENNEFFSIVHDGQVEMRIRTLNNPLYELKTLYVTDKQYASCYRMCSYLASQGIQFDNTGMYCSVIHRFMPCLQYCNVMQKPFYHHKSTYCSKIITQVLQHIQLEEVQHLNPYSVSPSDLFDAVQHSYLNVFYSNKIFKDGFHLHMPPQTPVP